MLKEEKMPNYTQKTQEDELKDILKMLTIIEKKMQKILYENEKEQTECKSECSKPKIELIKRKLQLLQNILIEIG